MKNKLYWTSFLTYLILTVSVMTVDRIYLFHQAEQNIKHELQNMASAIIASDLSIEVLTKYESTDDIMRDLLENQRLDRTLRVFDTEENLVFANQLAKNLSLEASKNLWSYDEIDGHKLNRLTIRTQGYILEVGLYPDPLLSEIKSHSNQITLALLIILIIGLVVSYLVTEVQMRPLKMLGHFFVNYGQKMKLEKSPALFTDSDKSYLVSLAESNLNTEVSYLAKSLLRFLENIQDEQKRKQSDLYILAHELKTPLAQIVFGLEQARSSDQLKSEEIDRMLKICRELSEFIRDYLRIASLKTQSKVDLELSAVRLTDFIKEIKDQLISQDQARLVITADNDVTVFAEKQLLYSLVLNLISNSLKYSVGPVAIKINNSFIEVIDSGPGFNQKSLEKLGQLFNRSNNSESSGLGLAYCFEIAKLFGWKIQYERINEKTHMKILFDQDSVN